MGRTRMGRTDGRTDGQGGDYMLPRNFSGSIKTLVLVVARIRWEMACRHAHNRGSFRHLAFHRLNRCRR